MLLNDTDLTKLQLKDICFIKGGSYIKGNLPKDNFDCHLMNALLMRRNEDRSHSKYVLLPFKMHF